MELGFPCFLLLRFLWSIHIYHIKVGHISRTSQHFWEILQGSLKTITSRRQTSLKHVLKITSQS